MPAMALTDHGNMFGTIEFYSRSKAAGASPSSGWKPTWRRGAGWSATPTAAAATLAERLLGSLGDLAEAEVAELWLGVFTEAFIQSSA